MLSIRKCSLLLPCILLFFSFDGANSAESSLSATEEVGKLEKCTRLTENRATVDAARRIISFDGDLQSIDKEAINVCRDALESKALPPMLEPHFQVSLAKALIANDFLKDSVSYLLKAAESDDVVAKSAIATLYAKGLGLEQNLDLAKSYFKSNFGKDGGYAEYMYASILWANSEGDGIDKKTFEIFENSAISGYVKAERLIGIELYLGNNVKRDYASAYKYLTTSFSKKKDAKVALILGNLSLGIEGIIERNMKESISYYEYASKQYASANYALGFLYQNGQEVDVDLEKSLSYYEAAYKAGDDQAQEKIVEVKNAIIEEKQRAAKKAAAEKLEREFGYCLHPEVGVEVWGVFGEGSSALTRKGYIAQVAKRRVKIDWEYCSSCTRAPWVDPCSLYQSKYEADARVRKLDSGHISGKEVIGAAALIGGALLLNELFGSSK